MSVMSIEKSQFTSRDVIFNIDVSSMLTVMSSLLNSFFMVKWQAEM